MSFISELKRRNVVRAGLAYGVGAWVLLQAVDFVLDAIAAPNWILQVFVLVAAAGLPAVLAGAWLFEITPEGIKREKEVDRAHSITAQTGRKLDRLITVLLTLAVVLLLADRFAGDRLRQDAGDDRAQARSRQSAAAEGRSAATRPDEIAGSRSATAPSSQEKSIAVLPFVNMSSDPEQEYFSDGLAEELLNRLAQDAGLRVAARTSAFQFKGQNLDVAAIGRQLNVANVLEGSVRKSGNRLRVTAQLIDVANGFHLWSETYERELTDVFAIQDEISAAIAQSLQLRLGSPSGAGAEKPTANLEAYNLYLKGRYYLATRLEKNMLQAATLFQQAVELDAKFSAAWSGLAFTYSLLPAYGDTVSNIEGGDKTIQYAGTAIDLDPQNAEAWIARGRMQGVALWDWASSEASLQQALLLAPNDINVVNLYGDTRTSRGAFAQAETYERRAVELDPLTAVQYGDLADLMLIMNRNQQGLEYARTAANLAPDAEIRVGELILALTRSGLFDEARELIERTAQSPGTDPGLVAGWWCQYFFDKGEEASLRGALARYIELAEKGRGFVSTTEIAFYSAWLDGAAAALPWLEQAYQQREVALTWPAVFYLPERVSTDPEWLAFWARPGLRELMDLRRANGPYQDIGFWKQRP
jgi:TolB-like protein